MNWSLRDAFDRLFDSAFTPVFGDGYQVALLMPGVDPQSVDITALGNTIADAQHHAYQAMKKIHFDGMHYRTDIGHQAIKFASAAT